MPVLGEETFDGAVKKVMKESDVSKESTSKIVGSAEKKARLKIKMSKLKLKVQIANLKTLRNKIQLAAEGDTSTSQSEGSPDSHHFTLKTIKRKGFPEGRGVKEQVGMLRLASQDEKFAKYYLLDSQDTNGNGWGVSETSIDQNIKSFIDMPFVVTAQEWIPDSEYEDQFDHPFIPTNDLRAVFAHQEKFRVGTIEKVAKDDDGKWYAMIKINSKFAQMSLPPFCSPAIYQINPHEPDDNISQWIGLHLAGLMTDPAYGPRVAILRGSCLGDGTSCSHQFKMAQLKPLKEIKPIKQVGQSGLDITETDKTDSPFEKEEKKESIKEASCLCENGQKRLSGLSKQLQSHLSLKTRISKLKAKKQRYALHETRSKIESVDTIPPIPKVEPLPKHEKDANEKQNLDEISQITSKLSDKMISKLQIKGGKEYKKILTLIAATIDIIGEEEDI